jgi:hypothetical protein
LAGRTRRVGVSMISIGLEFKLGLGSWRKYMARRKRPVRDASIVWSFCKPGILSCMAAAATNNFTTKPATTAYTRTCICTTF